MNKANMISAVLGAMMLATAGATIVVTPTEYLWKTLPPLTLETAIPAQFGDWREEVSTGSLIVNPQSLELINKLYSQTLSRTYVNRNGDRIMLTIAYGHDQRDGMEVHQPEVCYPAQGFQVTSSELGALATPLGPIAVKRLETNLGNQRYEPVTYWTTLGERVVTGGLKKKMAEMRYGLNGKIPDGMLFRISSIDHDSAHAFASHAEFANALELALPSANRRRLMGMP